MIKGFYTQIPFLLTGGAKLEFVCIAFSGDGKKLASLSGLPDFKLVLWYRIYHRCRNHGSDSPPFFRELRGGADGCGVC